MYIGRLGDSSNPMDGGLNDDVFQFPVGLNGIGTRAASALPRGFVLERLPCYGLWTISRATPPA